MCVTVMLVYILVHGICFFEIVTGDFIRKRTIVSHGDIEIDIGWSYGKCYLILLPIRVKYVSNVFVFAGVVLSAIPCVVLMRDEWRR